ncbi:MAG: hypothetical protein V1656_00750, partial [Candidatus Jorgensenbacteria bacterium]
MENFEAGRGQGPAVAPEASVALPTMEGSGQAEEPKKPRFWKFAAWFVGIIAVVLAAASLVDYLSPAAQRERELQRNYQQYQKGMSEMEEVLRADTYGGKTPQEMLDMFVDALKKGVVELAIKYFALESNTESPDYLSRYKWELSLNETY